MARVQFQDTMLLDDKSVRRTGDGYLVAFARVARTGIQIYRGSEVGRPDLDQVRVYRPEKEVFSHDTLRSFAHRPVTLDHPPAGVSSKNWKEVAVGQTGGEVAKDGEFIRVPLVVMDQGAIRRVDDGVKELSMGYSTDLKWGGGITTDGQPYDAVQTAIRGNHLAIVPAARGGPMLAIGDSREKGKSTMNDRTRTVMVDGVPLEVADGVAASLITKTLDKKEKKIKNLGDQLEAAIKKAEDAAAALATATAAHKAAMDAKDGELAVAAKAVKDAVMGPEKIDAMVKDRLAVITKAKTILGDAFVADGKTDADIRKAAVAHKLGDEVVKTMNDDTIGGAFAALAVGDKTQQQDGTRRLAMSLGDGSKVATAAADREKAYDDQGKHLANAWRNPPPAGATH